MNDEKTMENTVDTPVTNENVTPSVSQPAESNETAATENGAPQAGSPTAAPAIDPAAGGAPAPKKKKTPIIIAVAAVVVVAMVALFLLLGGKTSAAGKAPEEATEPKVLYAQMADDGTAYISMMDGSCITINDEVQDAAITKDRKYIVVLLKDGTLYVTDRKQSEKKMIAENGSALSVIRNEGFFYLDEEDIVYRVLFSDLVSKKLNEMSSNVVADDTLTILYATDAGNIYVLKNTETEPEKLSSATGDIEAEDISNDGLFAAWVEKAKSSHTIVISENGETEKLGEVDSKYNYTRVNFTTDEKMAVIMNLYADTLWIKPVGGELVKAKLGANVANTLLFSEAGYVDSIKAKDVKNLYVAVDAEEGTNVYCISADGDRERLLSKVDDFYVQNDMIVYMNMDNTLYWGKVSGTEISDEQKIASDVDMFVLTDCQDYVYYMKDCSSNLGTLYCYKLGTEEPVKVASDVGCVESSYTYTNMGCRYFVDGSGVFFYKDLEEVKGTYRKQGTLMYWEYGAESAEKIASEVLFYGLDSGMAWGGLDPNSLTYLKYNSVDKDDNIYANMMYYNGKESVKLAADVICD